MARLALCLPLADEDRLALEAERHGHEVVARSPSAQELAAVIGARRADAVVVASTPRYLSDRVLAVCDASGARVVALTADDEGRRHAASLGLFDTVALASAWSEIEDVLARPRPTAAVEPRRGTVITVWGPSGAPGRTTLAIGIAAELAALGHSVALADVDTHGASVAPALGILDEAPGFAAACRLAGNDSLTNAELDALAHLHSGGFRVLTGIGRPSRWPELSAVRVAATIEQCRSWVDYLVLDTSSSLEGDEELTSDLVAPRRNAAALTAVRSADQLVAVGSADPVGMSRFLRAYVDLVEVAQTHHVLVAVNRLRASAIGLNPGGQVVRTLSRFGGIESPVLVPWDQQALDTAVLTGRTLPEVAPKSAARLALRDLVATRIAPVPSG